MNICKKCVLPETFPDIHFDAQGICNHCNQHEFQEVFEDNARYEKEFIALINKVAGRGSYDILVAYSGGKDSSFTLKLLKEKFNLNILALSFDNGFISKLAMDNIKKVTERLDIDLEIVAPPVQPLKQVFSYALQDESFSLDALKVGSSVCAYCIGMVKAAVLKKVVQEKIPLCGWGWSPGQEPISACISPLEAGRTRAQQLFLKQKIQSIVGNQLDELFLDTADFAAADILPTNVHPLAFIDYDETTMFQALDSLGWARPQDTDKNSSNCVLNALAVKEHNRKLGFHPYAWEIAMEVRLGRLSRKEGIEKIYGKDNDEIAATAQNMLDET